MTGLNTKCPTHGNERPDYLCSSRWEAEARRVSDAYVRHVFELHNEIPPEDVRLTRAIAQALADAERRTWERAVGAMIRVVCPQCGHGEMHQHCVQLLAAVVAAIRAEFTAPTESTK